MIDVPRDVKQQLFPKFVKRGGVLRVQKYPGLATGPRDKFIVLLNREFRRDAEVFHVLTTSQIQDLPFRQHAVILPAGTLQFFPVETAIVCREVYALYYVDFEERYMDGTVDFVGALPPATVAEIDAIIRDSPYIAPSMRRQIIGE